MKKLNNKILIIVLLVLAGVFTLSRVFRASTRESNLRHELVNLDTAAVTEIKIYPNAEKNHEVKLIREGKNWSVQMDSRSAAVEQGAAHAAMNYFIHLKPLQMISKKKTKWKEFNVGDTSTQVKFMKGSEVLADVRIGRIGFNQQAGQQFNAGGVFTYVRLSDEQEVYSVEGFLESSFNKSFNDWRDKAFLRVKKDMITRVEFQYPADSGFVVEKKDKTWWVGEKVADSVKVKNFLSQLEYKNATTFADDFSPAGSANLSIQINNASGTLATVEAWKRAEDWAVTSSHQRGVYFSSKGLESVIEKRKYFLEEK